MSDDHEKPGAAASGTGSEATRPGAAAADTKLLESTFRIEAMDCPTEEALLRKRLSGMPGVFDLSFDLMRRQLTVQHGLPSIDPIVDAVASLGMKAEPAVSGVPDEAIAVAPAGTRESWTKDRKSKATFRALCGAVYAAGSCRQAARTHAARPSTPQFRCSAALAEPSVPAPGPPSSAVRPLISHHPEYCLVGKSMTWTPETP